MRAMGIAPVSFMMATLMISDADAASNRWCAVIPKRSENCGYATLDQCRAYMLDSGAGADRIPSPERRLGPAAPGRPVRHARIEAGIRGQARQIREQPSAHRRISESDSFGAGTARSWAITTSAPRRRHRRPLIFGQASPPKTWYP